MEEMYNVSSNPHVRDKMTTSRIMQLVVIALLPATLFGIWNFGFHALLVVLVTVISSVFFEWLFDRLMHKKNTITDCKCGSFTNGSLNITDKEIFYRN